MALGGLGGVVAGAIHLSKHKYKNNHIRLSSDGTSSSESAKDVDVKRQPETSLNPKQQEDTVTK